MCVTCSRDFGRAPDDSFDLTLRVSERTTAEIVRSSISRTVEIYITNMT